MSDEGDKKPTKETAKNEEEEEEEESEGGKQVLAKEEECKAQFTPQVSLDTLPEIETKTMEENEEALFKMYVFFIHERGEENKINQERKGWRGKNEQKKKKLINLNFFFFFFFSS